MVLLPGLIDGHTHIGATKSAVDEFVKHVIPGGTTTVITETMDLPFIAGEDALKHWIKGFEGQPIRIYYTVPPLCGLTPSEEINALTAEDLLPYLKDPHCLGLGEIYWSNLFIPGPQGEEAIRSCLHRSRPWETNRRPHGGGIRKKTAGLLLSRCFIMP